MNARLPFLAAFLVPVALVAALRVTQLTGFGVSRSGEPGTPPPPSDYAVWHAAVVAAGGTFGTNSEEIASDLAAALAGKSYSAKIIYLLPLLGSNLAAARVPLRDSLGVGIATNHSFTDGDFNEATGLQSDGGSKYLDTLIFPGNLGTNAGGLGYWETNMAFDGSGVEPIGNYNTAMSERFVLDIRSTFANVRWGNAGVASGPGGITPANGHYYGQRVSTTNLRLFIDGAQIGTPNTTSETPTGALERTIWICATIDGKWHGRCAVAYLTDGSLTDAEAADFHELLNDYLITPTGR